VPKLDHPSSGEAHQSLTVWAVFFACIVAFMGLGLVDPILTSIAAQLSATPAQVTLLFTSYNGVMALAMLITGYLSSRLGIKATLLLGVTTIAVFSTLGGLSDNIWVLVGLRGLWGLGNALFVATALSAIVSFSKNGTAKAVILYEAAIGIGFSVGPLFGGTLGSISWRWPFLGVGMLMLVGFIALTLFMPRTKITAQERKRTTTSFSAPFRALRHRSLLVFGISAGLYNIGFFTLLAFVPFVMGLDAQGIGYVFLGWGILLAVTSVFLAPILKEKFGTINALVGVMVLFAALLAAIGIWTHTQWVVIAAVVLSGAMMGNINTLLTTAAMNAAPIARSTASATYSFLRFIGSAIAPIMAGLLAEWFSPHIPFLVAGFAVLLSVGFMLVNRGHVDHVDEAESGHGEAAPLRPLASVSFMSTQFVAVTPQTTIKEVIERFLEHKITSVPVLGDDQKLVGMVSDGDIIRYLSPQEDAVYELFYSTYVAEQAGSELVQQKMLESVSKIMRTKRLLTLDREKSFDDALLLFAKHHIRRIPVVDAQGRVVGVIGHNDMVSNLWKQIVSKT